MVASSLREFFWILWCFVFFFGFYGILYFFWILWCFVFFLDFMGFYIFFGFYGILFSTSPSVLTRVHEADIEPVSRRWGRRASRRVGRASRRVARALRLDSISPLDRGAPRHRRLELRASLRRVGPLLSLARPPTLTLGLVTARVVPPLSGLVLRSLGRMRQVEEGSRAPRPLRPVLRPRNLRRRHLPEPRVVVDHLHLQPLQQTLPHLDGRLVGLTVLGRVVPLLEVNEDPLVLLAAVVLALDHVDALEHTEVEIPHDRSHPRLGDVRKDTRDTDAGLARRHSGGVDGKRGSHC